MLNRAQANLVRIALKATSRDDRHATGRLHNYGVFQVSRLNPDQAIHLLAVCEHAGWRQSERLPADYWRRRHIAALKDPAAAERAEQVLIANLRVDHALLADLPPAKLKEQPFTSDPADVARIAEIEADLKANHNDGYEPFMLQPGQDPEWDRQVERFCQQQRNLQRSAS